MQKKYWPLIMVLISFIVVIGLNSNVVFCSEEGIINAQITGKITNLKEANNYLYGNSYIILVHAEEKISLGLHASGALIMVPANDRSQPILDTGIFTFKSPKMKPGIYRLFVQPVKGFSLTIFGHDLCCSFIAREGKDEAIEINVPAQRDNTPVTIDLGNVSIYTP